VAENRGAGRTTFVHCHAGVSRSGLVTIAYLMYEHGLSRNQALAIIRNERPQVRPNPAFMELLAHWERELESLREISSTR
jgi:protein-tyrosine phosphatase